MIKRFDEVFEDVTRLGTKVKTDEYHLTGKHPIVDQGHANIPGYTDLEDGLFENVPAIIFGDHTRIIKYVDEPFFLGADGVKVLRSRYADANYRYLYYALRNKKIPNTGYNRHFKWLKESQIEYPSAEKQSEIVLVLDSISSVIEHRQQQLQKLDDLVKARFVEMFGDYLKDDRRPLSEVAIITGGLTKNSNRNTFETKMPYLRVANVFYNRLDLREILEIGVKEEEIEKTLLQAGDLLFVEGNGSIEQIGRVAIWDGSIDPILHQNHLIKARFNNEIIAPEYALFYFMLQDGRQQIISKSVSTSGLNTLSVNKVSSLLLPIPPIALQKQFGEFVNQTDKSKLTISETLTELETLKNSLMQQYFG